ncbi:MAG: calycin-like domain-containing protein [Bacteroidales bacterium]|nr:calycin-like domain-containing protein [Bacteroidales bacterium]
MKKWTTLLLAFACTTVTHAQLQVQNGGFELWENEDQATIEPAHWNSFKTASGALNRMGSQQVEKSTDAHSGSYAVRIFSRSVFGVVAQGNLTTGRINMGTTNATDATGNYNYTDTSDDNFNQPITGFPDAMSVWVKASCQYNGAVNCTLHTEGYFQDPAANDITAKVVAKADNSAVPSTDTWQQITIPFLYNLTDGTRPAYALITLSTSGEPGKGSSGDWLIADDLEFLYYSELESALWNGTAVTFNGTNATIDGSYDDASRLRIRSNGHGAAVDTTYNAADKTLTILIQGEDIADNPQNKHTYTITFTGKENGEEGSGTVVDPDDPTVATSPLIPNGTFEEWKEACGSTLVVGSAELQRPGTEPTGWNGSSLHFKKILSTVKEVLVEKTDGFSGSGVRMSNFETSPTWAAWDRYIRPGYITLGTPWIYHSTGGMSDYDGGTYGGIGFTLRPDAIRGHFKRDNNITENAHIIAYIWRGTFTSKIGALSNPNSVVENADRAILGKDAKAEGNGQLIASCDYSFASTTNDDWQQITVPLQYVSGQEEATPEKMNIIISAADYWTHDNQQASSSLIVDNLEFLYYSELASATYDGTDIEFEDGQGRILAEYDPALLQLKSNGQGATITTEYDANYKVLTIIVRGADISENPSNVHRYSVQFGPQIVNSTSYTDLIKVTVNDYATTTKRATITLDEMSNGITNFTLKNFTMGDVDNPTYVGTIIVEDIDISGNTIYANRNITIQNGDMPADARWMGPSLGNVPIVLDGAIRNDSLHIHITIDMTQQLNQQIDVLFGQSLIEDIERENQPEEPEDPEDPEDPQEGQTGITLEGTHVYEDDLVVTLNGSANAPQQTSIKVVFHDDNTLDLSLEDFVMYDGGDVMGVGNVVLKNVPFSLRSGTAYATFKTSEDIVITEGSNPEIFWTGPLLGSIPVTLSGKVGEDKLYCTIDIKMAGVGDIHVVFGADSGWPKVDEGGQGGEQGGEEGGEQEPQADPILRDYTFDEMLTVTVNGETSKPENAKITLSVNDDGTINLALNDFWLATEDGVRTAIGTIRLQNILPVLVADKDYYMFMVSNSIQIQNGSDTNEFWIGPLLGDIPVSMSGKISMWNFYTSISIFMPQMGEHGENILVLAGDDFSDAIQAVTQSRQLEATQGIYTLSGQRITKLTQPGIYIVNGKKVAVR